jgi:ABC-2 type transport system permease protein
MRMSSPPPVAGGGQREGASSRPWARLGTSLNRPNSKITSTTGSSRQRIRALVIKETRQLLRDKGNIMVGMLLPVLLILIFGYGLSFDVKNMPVAIVMEDASPTAADVVAGFYLSPYFSPMTLTSMRDAEALMLDRKVDGIVHLKSDFSRDLASGSAAIQLLVNGVDANRARVMQGYAQGAIGQWAARRSAAGEGASDGLGSVRVEQRAWFNEANSSAWFLVPGLIVIIMTLIGAFLTALVMAREWERGTLEALFVTPVRSTEVLISKIVPYFCVGLVGLVLCLLAARFLFAVPIRGSLWLILLASMLYLLVALGIGLLISSAVKNQFLASQIALIVSFLPALMLSGFIFDLRSVPVVVRAISSVLPATYYVELLQTLFLVGNVWWLVVRDCAVLALSAFVLLALARMKTRKELT